jgi:propane monooxygenase coupling protein
MGLAPAETHWTLERFYKYSVDDFEEIMSTHYGRMVVLDDKVSLFANPEDAAEYIGFDLQPVE